MQIGDLRVPGERKLNKPPICGQGRINADPGRQARLDGAALRRAREDAQRSEMAHE